MRNLIPNPNPMKKVIYTAAVLFVSFYSQLLWAQSAQESVAEADKELNNLIIRNNASKAESYYLADFILTTSSGIKKFKKDILNEVASPDLKLEINETLEVVVREYNATAILTGVLHQKGTYKGKSFDAYMNVTDTWIQTPEGWKLFAGHASVIPNYQTSSN
jgi:ketosteroid isomerase-like protein